MPLPPPPPPPPMAPPPVPEGTMKPRGPPPFLSSINARSPQSSDGEPRSPPPPGPPGPPPAAGAPPPPGPPPGPRGGLLAAIQNRGDSPLKTPPPPSSASPASPPGPTSSSTPSPPQSGAGFVKQLDLKVKPAKDSDDEGWSDDASDDGRMRGKVLAPMATLKSAVSKPPVHSKLPPARPGPPPGMSSVPDETKGLSLPPPPAPAAKGPPPPAPAAKGPPPPAPAAKGPPPPAPATKGPPPPAPAAAPKPVEPQKRTSVQRAGSPPLDEADFFDANEPDEPLEPQNAKQSVSPRRSSSQEKAPSAPNTPPRIATTITTESAVKEVQPSAPASSSKEALLPSKDTNDKLKKLMESLKDENSELRKKLEQAEAKLLLTKSAAGPSMIQGREAELGKELDTAYGRINILKEEKHTLETSIKALHARLGIAEGKIEAASKVHISNIMSVDSLKRNEREQDLEKQLVKARKDKDKAIKLIILLVGKEKMGDFLKNHAGSPDILDEMVNSFGGGLSLLESSFHSRSESPGRGGSSSPRARQHTAGKQRFDTYEESKLRESARNDAKKYLY